MAGHSKFANIKHRKAAQDKKRGKIFTKLIREITVAARSGGGGDVAANPRLRLAVDKALAANMTRDTIERAIKRGTGEGDDTSYDEIRYEGYGPAGTAIMVDCLTDNRNRTGPEIKKLFEKHGGSLGTSGCVNWMFSQKGLITVNTSNIDEEELFEIALSAGANDIQTLGEVYEITCEPSAYEQLKKTLQGKEIVTEVAEISMVPQNTIEINDGHIAGRIIALMEAFDDHDDVQNAYANFDIPDEVMEKIS